MRNFSKHPYRGALVIDCSIYPESFQLTHFMLLVSFYNAWNHQKTRYFQTFSGGIKRLMGWNLLICILLGLQWRFLAFFSSLHWLVNLFFWQLREQLSADGQQSFYNFLYNYRYRYLYNRQFINQTVNKIRLSHIKNLVVWAIARLELFLVRLDERFPTCLLKVSGSYGVRCFFFLLMMNFPQLLLTCFNTSQSVWNVQIISCCIFWRSVCLFNVSFHICIHQIAGIT